MEDQYNLIYNGKMVHGMDGYSTGFSNLTYGIDTNDKPSCCSASYLVYSSNRTENAIVYNTGWFPLIPYIKEDTYKLHFLIKANSLYEKLAYYYFALSPYDNRGKHVNCWDVCVYEPNGSTVTTLAQDLNNGDTNVYLTDASKWVADQTYRYLGIIESAAWKDDRMLYGQKIVKNSINTTDNTLTLQTAWNGGTYKAGSKVRMFTDTMQYYYPANWTSSTIPDNWTEYNIDFKASDLWRDYKNMMSSAYFLGIACDGRIKVADFRLENLSHTQVRVPNINLYSSHTYTYPARFDDYTESTSSVNKYGQLNTGMLSEGFIPVRYIRDRANGYILNSSNEYSSHWKEIQAFDRWGRNVAFAADGTIPQAYHLIYNYSDNVSRGSLNKTNTTTFKPMHLITKGYVDNGTYIDNWGISNGTSVTIDMGIVHYIDKIKIWHFNNDARTYHNTKTEVSVDGVNWTTVFDSAIEGEYVETAEGHTITFDKLGTIYHASFKKGGETLVLDLIED